MTSVAHVELPEHFDSASQRRPRFKPPAGSCDTHVHIWGPKAKFPYAARRNYTPPDRPKEDLATIHGLLGIDRAVIVQSSVYGTDHRAMLDAIAAAPAKRRGVAIVDDTTDDDALAALHAGGVRGVRFGFSKHHGGAADTREFESVARRVGQLGWHVVLHLQHDELRTYRRFIDGLPGPFVIDHMGRVNASEGLDAPLFRDLLALAADPRCWIKLSGAERLVGPAGLPLGDAVPFGRALAAVAPDRAIWGTDFPHPNNHVVPNDADLVDLLPEMLPYPALQQAVLVDNPARLYRFEEEA